MLSFPLVAAESAISAVKSAAQKLGDAQNYSWTSNSRQEGSEQTFRVSAEGKTEKGGFTQISLTFGDRTVDVALKGGKVAVKQDDEWKSADELEGGGAFMARRFQNFKAPTAEAEDLAGKAKELKSGADGLYSGDLTEEGVKELFARYRRPNAQGPAAKEAKGWVKFWIKNGALTKYEYNVQGKVPFGQDQEERAVNRTTMVEIKDVGATKLSVPAEAKKKLS